MTQTVLITGITGYIASHCLKQLLEAGYGVKGTARNATKARKVLDAFDRRDLEIVEADLSSDKCWDEAVAGADYVLHVASPFPDAPPKDENDLIKPAMDGAERVLRAAARAGVKRVVMTSSMAAVASGYGKAAQGKTFTEADWSNLNGPIAAYDKSKTLAERRAWEVAGELGLDLVVINPGLVTGPLLADNAGTSLEVVERMLKGDLPGLPQIGFRCVDVRDVAAAHVAALTAPNAPGNRYCCVTEFLWFEDIAHMLKDALGEAADKVPTRKLPNVLVRLGSLFDPSLKLITPNLGVSFKVDTTAIERDLGFTPHDLRQSVIETAQSLIQYGEVDTLER